jgi:hypothetical protein
LLLQQYGLSRSRLALHRARVRLRSRTHTLRPGEIARAQCAAPPVQKLQTLSHRPPRSNRLSQGSPFGVARATAITLRPGTEFYIGLVDGNGASRDSGRRAAVSLPRIGSGNQSHDTIGSGQSQEPGGKTRHRGADAHRASPWACSAITMLVVAIFWPRQANLFARANRFPRAMLRRGGNGGTKSHFTLRCRAAWRRCRRGSRSCRRR